MFSPSSTSFKITSSLEVLFICLFKWNLLPIKKFIWLINKLELVGMLKLEMSRIGQESIVSIGMKGHVILL